MILGAGLLLRFIGVVNSPYRMSHAMEILTESAVSLPAMVIAVIFLFSITFFIVSKNTWLYSYVPFQTTLNDGNHVYPDLNSDIFAFVIVGILLLNSISFFRDIQGKKSDLNDEN